MKRIGFGESTRTLFEHGEYANWTHSRLRSAIEIIESKLMIEIRRAEDEQEGSFWRIRLPGEADLSSASYNGAQYRFTQCSLNHFLFNTVFGGRLPMSLIPLQ